MKKAQAVDFWNLLDPFWGFTLKQSSEIMIPAFHDYSLELKITKCGDLLYTGNVYHLALDIANLKTVHGEDGGKFKVVEKK